MADKISPIIPFLRYNDPNAAVDWLVKAFDFEPVTVATGDDGTVVHAALRFGTGVVTLGPAGQGPLDVRSPRDLPAVNQGVYVHLDGDVDAHHARSTSAGAEVVIELQDMEYGSREYAVRDPEGHIWSFGTYLPGAED
ncbi:MAG TPA: VOC family protein [Pilimelia sp.]|nr:VOC family protein [Pilimelia sp.]